MSEPKDDIDEFLYGNAEKDEVTDQVENEEGLKNIMFRGRRV